MEMILKRTVVFVLSDSNLHSNGFFNSLPFQHHECIPDNTSNTEARFHRFADGKDYETNQLLGKLPVCDYGKAKSEFRF